MNRRIGLVVVAVAVVWLSGCATSGPKSQVTAEEVAKFASLSPEEAIKAGDASLVQARQDELPFYAPRHFRDAEKAMVDARGLMAKKGDVRQIPQLAALSDKSVNEGRGVKASVLVTLKDELRLKKALEQVQAPQIFSRDNEKVVERLSALIAAIEDGKGDKIAKDQQKLNADMVALEVRTIKYSALNPAERVLAEAKAKGAEKLAAVTFKEGGEVYQRADAFIQQNAHDQNGVEKAGKDALFAAKHALAMVEGVKALEPVVKASLEQVIIADEGRLLVIGKALGAADVRDRSLAEQAQSLAKSAAALVAATPAAPTVASPALAPVAAPEKAGAAPAPVQPEADAAKVSPTVEPSAGAAGPTESVPTPTKE